MLRRRLTVEAAADSVRGMEKPTHMRMRTVLAASVAFALAALGACSEQPGATPRASAAQATDATAVTTNTSTTTAAATPTADVGNPGCLSYGEWRTSLTSDGPPYPLPVFAPEVERRCVVAYRDNRSDIITIMRRGETPTARAAGLVFGVVPDAGGLDPAFPPNNTGLVIVRATTALGGQANADALLAAQPGWQAPSPVGDAYGGGLEARWRGIEITGDLPRPAMEAAIRSLDGRWRPVPAGARGNNRLRGMDEAANWHRLPDGRHWLAEIGAPYAETRNGDLGDYVQLTKRGSDVVFLVYHWESDNASCYRGRLAPDGRLTQAVQSSAYFNEEPDGGPRSVEDFWPDELAEEPLRPASDAVRRDQASATQGWGGDRCTQVLSGRG